MLLNSYIAVVWDPHNAHFSVKLYKRHIFHMIFPFFVSFVLQAVTATFGLLCIFFDNVLQCYWSLYQFTVRLFQELYFTQTMGVE